MKIKIVATTNVGKVRENNEDAFIICPDLSHQEWKHDKTPSYIPLGDYGSLMVVADGMGGTNAGEVASMIAVKTVEEVFSQANIGDCISNDNIDILLQKCVKEADEAINRRVWDDPATIGMGTTIVICWILNEVAHIAWCGDSRCYIFNPQTGLLALTKDHSYVQELVDKGEISVQEAFNHPDSNIITRGLGDVDSQSTPDITSHPLKANDMLLLCSDGLSGYCTDTDIEDVLRSNYRNISECNEQLLQLALQAGGHDNICLVLASLIDNSQEAPSDLSNHKKWKNGLKRLLNLC